MSTINEKQDDIIEEFGGFDDWLDRYQLLIDLGSEQPPLDEQYKTDNNLIEGCRAVCGCKPITKMARCFSAPRAMRSL